MVILVVNTGSSSLKYRLFDTQDNRSLAGGVMERIGESSGIWTHSASAVEPGKEEIRTLEIKDHRQGLRLAIERISNPKNGVVSDVSKIDAVGHRVVQGGETFTSAVRIDETVKQAIRDNFALAPLHNPHNLTGIETAGQLLPDIPNIAVFDTQFHQTMPLKSFLYGLPYEYYTDYKIRKYGYHGTSHKYIARQAARLMNKEPDQVNLITLHLGNGCSVSAIEKGRCVDTSMGMTPLAGVMMGTRTGDLDPAVIGYLVKQTGMHIEQVETVLNQKSGLKGLCGLNDFRDIHKAAAKKDPRAVLALEMFCYRIRKYIGAYTAVLGSVDAIVFSAGIGENDPIVRKMICENLEGLGIDPDEDKNLTGNGAFSFHSDTGRVQIWVVPTNEELQIAMEVCALLTD